MVCVQDLLVESEGANGSALLQSGSAAQDPRRHRRVQAAELSPLQRAEESALQTRSLVQR